MESGSLNEGVGGNQDMMVTITHCQCLGVVLAALLTHTLLLILPKSKSHLATGSYRLTLCTALYYHFSPKSGELKSRCTAPKKLLTFMLSLN